MVQLTLPNWEPPFIRVAINRIHHYPVFNYNKKGVAYTMQQVPIQCQSLNQEVTVHCTLYLATVVDLLL